MSPDPDARPDPAADAPGQRRALARELSALGLLAFVALVLLALTPRLILPFKPEVPWYESAASFPRTALALMALGAIVEGLRRLRGMSLVVTEELDTSTARMPRMLAALASFTIYALAVPQLGFGVSSALFLAFTARAVGLGWRAALLLALPMALGMWLVFVYGLNVAFGHGLLF